MLVIYTLGYEGKTLEKCLDILTNNLVTAIVDVREKPYSRKPGFAGTILEETVSKPPYRMFYLSDTTLGTPTALRDRFKKDKDVDLFKKDFKKLYSQRKEALKTLLETIRGKFIPCLLCYEADPHKCHRSIVAEELANLHGNAKVVHL